MGEVKFSHFYFERRNKCRLISVSTVLTRITVKSGISFIQMPRIAAKKNLIRRTKKMKEREYLENQKNSFREWRSLVWMTLSFAGEGILGLCDNRKPHSISFNILAIVICILLLPLELVSFALLFIGGALGYMRISD